MFFIHDTRDQKGKHENLERYLMEHGHQIVRSKLYCGDVSLLHDQTTCIDLKKDFSEVCNNLCQQHLRFRAELLRAQAAGIKLIILIETSRNYESLEDVKKWVNPRLKKSPLALSGPALYVRMCTIAEKYGVEWKVCERRDTGWTVCELLGVNRYDAP